MDREVGKRPLQHESFILTLWQESEASSSAPPVWRFSLENPHTNQRTGFADIEALADFLQQWVQGRSQPTHPRSKRARRNAG